MKMLWDRMLTAILAGIMLFSSILTAGAIDEEYFPTVLGLEAFKTCSMTTLNKE